MTEEGGKVTGIRQIVRLREILQRWHSIALNSHRGGPSGKPDGIPPVTKRRLWGSKPISFSDEESGQSPGPAPPPDVPKGYLAVYVGPELRRFIIPTSYLSLPAFKVLLEKAEEEFGFDHKGGLTLPCEIETFKYILQCMEHNQKEVDDKESNLSSLQQREK